MASNSPYRSSSDLVMEVLSRAGVISIGQAVDVEDFQTVQKNLDSIFRKVAALEICFVSDANNIPGAWFSDLVDIVLGECAKDIGLSDGEYAAAIAKGLGGPPSNVEVGAGGAAQSLKIITRGRPTYEPLRFVNY